MRHEAKVKPQYETGGLHREGGLRNGSPGGRIGCMVMPCLLSVAAL